MPFQAKSPAASGISTGWGDTSCCFQRLALTLYRRSKNWLLRCYTLYIWPNSRKFKFYIKIHPDVSNASKKSCNRDCNFEVMEVDYSPSSSQNYFFNFVQSFLINNYYGCLERLIFISPSPLAPYTFLLYFS